MSQMIADGTKILSSRNGKITINGKKVSYKIIAQMINTQGVSDNYAKIFSISYLRTNLASVEKRPITFVFQGGPGSSSMWLHFGCLGPQRLVFPNYPHNTSSNFSTNNSSLLEITDLVFVDPVGTGYSTAKLKKNESMFWSVSADALVLANFIGESFSTNRDRPPDRPIRPLKLNSMDKTLPTWHLH